MSFKQWQISQVHLTNSKYQYSCKANIVDDLCRYLEDIVGTIITIPELPIALVSQAELQSGAHV